MTTFIAGLFLAATLALAPLFGFLALITMAAAWPRRAGPSSSAQPRTRFLIVIPAHDEAGAIGSTVRSCRAVDYNPDLFSIHVIADNCSDSTADEAREAGASVVERSDPTLRSKGHALEYFFTQVPEGRPDSGGYDAAILIDADTVVAPDLLRAFDRAVAEGKDWVQGYYTVRNPDASWRTRLLTYAFSLANGVWMLGLERLGLGVGLKGNGMCFSAKGLRRVPWRAHGLVEDMEFALMLRTRGERVRFEPSAEVFGEMVSRGGAGAESQRARWEVGRSSLRGAFAGPLAKSPELGLYRKLLYLLDLFFPPLVTLGLGLILISLVHPIAWLVPDLAATAHRLAPAHAIMWLAMAAYASSPILILKLPVRYLASLLAIPYYAGWKLRVALDRRPDGWVRTPREPHVPS
jgi:cellulose synthase/poly-beta-1,6-N-acetylglucosamine synthase-like glycosyltransferase